MSHSPIHAPASFPPDGLIPKNETGDPLRGGQFIMFRIGTALYQLVRTHGLGAAPEYVFATVNAFGPSLFRDSDPRRCIEEALEKGREVRRFTLLKDVLDQYDREMFGPKASQS